MSDGIFGRILGFLRSGPPGAGRDRYEDLAPDLPDADAMRVAAGLKACLLGSGGRVTARGRCLALGHAYLALAPDGRRRFLDIIARDFAADGASTLAAPASCSLAGESRSRTPPVMASDGLSPRVPVSWRR